MVVNQINIAGVSFLEAEYDAPVRPDGHAPEIFQFSSKTVKPETGQIHVFRLSGTLQNEKDVFYFIDLIRADPFGFALLKQPFQSFMPKTSNHPVLFPALRYLNKLYYDK